MNRFLIGWGLYFKEHFLVLFFLKTSISPDKGVSVAGKYGR